MAYVTAPWTLATANVAVAGTSVAPSNPMPENCDTMIVRNTSNVDSLYGIAAPGVGTLTEGTNAVRLPAGTAITLPLGTVNDRGIMDQGNIAGSGYVFQNADAGQLPTHQIQYLNKRGPLGLR